MLVNRESTSKLAMKTDKPSLNRNLRSVPVCLFGRV